MEESKVEECQTSQVELRQVETDRQLPVTARLEERTPLATSPEALRMLGVTDDSLLSGLNQETLARFESEIGSEEFKNERYIAAKLSPGQDKPAL